MKYSKKQQIIIETAAAMFRDKGYAATSMRELATAVDLKVSSLYSHFKSKEEILQHICFGNAEKFTKAMHQVEQSSGSPLQKIEQLLRFHIQMAIEDTTSVTAFNDEWRHLGEPHLSDFLKQRKDYENRFCAIIDAGKSAQQFQNMDTSIIFYTLLSSIRWLYDWKKNNVKKQADTLLELVLNGMVRN